MAEDLLQSIQSGLFLLKGTVTNVPDFGLGRYSRGRRPRQSTRVRARAVGLALPCEKYLS